MFVSDVGCTNPCRFESQNLTSQNMQLQTSHLIDLPVHRPVVLTSAGGLGHLNMLSSSTEILHMRSACWTVDASIDAYPSIVALRECAAWSARCINALTSRQRHLKIAKRAAAWPDNAIHVKRSAIDWWIYGHAFRPIVRNCEACPFTFVPVAGTLRLAAWLKIDAESGSIPFDSIPLDVRRMPSSACSREQCVPLFVEAEHS